MTPRSILSPARRPLALAILLTGFLALAGEAHANKTQQSVFQDDRMLLAYGTGVQNGALADMQAVGVDVVHADIGWDSPPPGPKASKAPEGAHPRSSAHFRRPR